MKNVRVHIAGPVTCLRKKEKTELYKFYEDLAKVCQDRGWHSFSPHRAMDLESYPELTPQEVYATELRNISQADILLAYVGRPALGVGTELEVARSQNSIIILLYEKEVQVSKVALGNPAVVHEIVFTDFPDAINQVQAALGKIEI